MSKVKATQSVGPSLTAPKGKTYRSLKGLKCKIFCLQTGTEILHIEGSASMPGWFLQNLSLHLLMLNSVESLSAQGQPVTTMELNSFCKIFQPVSLVSNIDSFDLHLGQVYSNEKATFLA